MRDSIILIVDSDLEPERFAREYPRLVGYVELDNLTNKEDWQQNFLNLCKQKTVVCIPWRDDVVQQLERWEVEYEIITRDIEMKDQKRDGGRKIWTALRGESLEEVVVREGMIERVCLNKSSFVFGKKRYLVHFDPNLKEALEIERRGFAQVYCVGELEGKIVVVYHGCLEKFNLPGGKREAKETIEQTLRRELLEETNCEVLDYQILGVQQNISEQGEVMPCQVRVFARLQKLGEFVRDSGGGVLGYKLVDLVDLEAAIGWGELGDWLRLRVKKLMPEYKN